MLDGPEILLLVALFHSRRWCMSGYSSVGFPTGVNVLLFGLRRVRLRYQRGRPPNHGRERILIVVGEERAAVAVAAHRLAGEKLVPAMTLRLPRCLPESAKSWRTASSHERYVVDRGGVGSIDGRSTVALKCPQ